MTHIILFISMSAFINYFYFIDYPWLILLPVVIVIVFSVNTIVNIKPTITMKSIIEKNSLYFSWILILLWLSGLLLFLNIDKLYVGIYMVIINLLLWIGSYMSGYSDWKQLFHVTYYLSILALIQFLSEQIDIRSLLTVVWYIIPLQFWIYSFIAFIIWNFYEVEKKITWLAYSFAHLTVLQLFTILIWEIKLIHIVLWQLYLTLVYYATNYILWTQRQEVKIKKIDAKDILRWVKVLEYQKVTEESLLRKNTTLLKIKWFLLNLDSWVTLFINSYNSIFIVLVILYYISIFSNQTPIIHEQILYRASIILFFINFILIQEHYILPKRQRIFVFLIINFAIYTNIIFLSWSQAVTIATLWILWNVANSLLILYSKFLLPTSFIKIHDYRYRILVNVVWIPINIFFLSQINIAGSLLFALISTYLWIQWFLLYYNIKYMQQKNITNE